MLNRDAANTARNRLKKAVEIQSTLQQTVGKLATDLYVLRRESSQLLIGEIEAFVNTLADAPAEFDRAFAEYQVQYRTFAGVVESIDRIQFDGTVRGGSAVGAGVAAGTATALLGPTAAMALATTFGTASTGTAIATLSGAAATNAALAWLGGGALAAGGGGMSAGGALLGLAGPVGWTLAGVAALGGAAYVAHSNSKVVEEANAKRVPVEKSIATLRAAQREVEGLFELTTSHVSGMRKMFERLQQEAPRSYHDFSSEQLLELGALINHVQSLSALLNKTVRAEGDA